VKRVVSDYNKSKQHKEKVDETSIATAAPSASADDSKRAAK
jgi:hypothetical protein